MQFKSFNFKLVVINELLRLGFFAQELANAKEKYWSDDYWEFTPIPDMKAFFEGLQLTQAHLEAVKCISFDGGNEIYFHLIPHWDGEDDAFDVKTLADVLLLPNLEEYVEISMVDTEDYAPLLTSPKLKRAYFGAKATEVRKQLTAKGVSLH